MRYLLAVALVIACSCGGNTTLPTREPDVIGTITNLSGDRVRVEEFPDRPIGSTNPGGNKGVFTVTSSTLIRERTGVLTLRDLAVGDHVRAWYRGPVKTSYPSQGEAEAIER